LEVRPEFGLFELDHGDSMYWGLAIKVGLEGLTTKLGILEFGHGD